MQDQTSMMAESEKQIEALKAQVEGCRGHARLKFELLEEHEYVHAIDQHLEQVEKDFSKVKVAYDLLKAKEKLNELKMHVDTFFMYERVCRAGWWV